jgi:methylated-DNA-[protein]-cysteine S-methyltransferase
MVVRQGRLAQIKIGARRTSFPFEVERTFGQPGSEAFRPFAEIRKQLEEYFAGIRLVFRIPLDLEQGTPFQRRVWKALRDIPYGDTVSYKEIAQAIGQSSATRAVGGALGLNPVPVVLPCHRVVANDGSLCGFSAGLEIKTKLLDLEGKTRARAAQFGMLGPEGPRPFRAPRER